MSQISTIHSSFWNWLPSSRSSYELVWVAVAQALGCIRALATWSAFPHFNRTLNEAAIKQKRAIETFVGLGWLWIFPRLRRVHLISDPEIIRQILKKNRGGAEVDSGFEELLTPLLTSDTMLLCPFSSHRRMRRPIENFFSKRVVIHSDTILQQGHRAFQYMHKLAASLKEAPLSLDSLVQDFVLINLLDLIGLQLDDAQFKILFEELETAKITKQPGPLKQLIENYFSKKPFRSCSAMEALDLDEQLSQAEKVNEVILLFAAGTHTTQNFILFFLRSVLCTPASTTLYQDCTKFFASRPKITTEAAYITALTEFVLSSDYLHACYLETLRCFPIIPLIKRVAKVPLKIVGMEISYRDELHLNLLAAQRKELDLGNTSHLFQPDRFRNYLSQDKNPSLLSFSLGPQSCLGRYLAESQSKLLVTLINFYLVTPEVMDFSATQKFLEEVDYNGFILSKSQNFKLLSRHRNEVMNQE